jgi:hypothetical protein
MSQRNVDAPPLGAGQRPPDEPRTPATKPCHRDRSGLVYVGGSQPLIDALPADVRFEAWAVRLDDPIDAAGDGINGLEDPGLLLQKGGVFVASPGRRLRTNSASAAPTPGLSRNLRRPRVCAQVRETSPKRYLFAPIPVG